MMLGVFEIHEPQTVNEASALLAEHGEAATVYAGGTELLLLMKEGLVHYPHLINIKTIPDLDQISPDNDALRIGPLVTHWQLEHHKLVQEQASLLAEVASMIANVRVRAVGTLGGNLCFAEPHSDPATLLLAWEATLDLTSANGRRELAIDEFILDMLTTAREHDEILTGITLPLLPPHSGGGYEKFATHERPSATVAAIVQRHNGMTSEARIAVGSVGAVPVRMPEAEAILRDEMPDDAAFEAAADAVSQAVDPIDDLYGSIEYKRNIARVLTIRALTTAAERAAGNKQ